MGDQVCAVKGFAEKELFSCCKSLIKRSLKATVSSWWCSVVDWWHIDTFVWEQTSLESFKYLAKSCEHNSHRRSADSSCRFKMCVALATLFNTALFCSWTWWRAMLRNSRFDFWKENVHLWNVDKYQANCFLDLISQINEPIANGHNYSDLTRKNISSVILMIEHIIKSLIHARTLYKKDWLLLMFLS